MERSELVSRLREREWEGMKSLRAGLILFRQIAAHYPSRFASVRNSSAINWNSMARHTSPMALCM